MQHSKIPAAGAADAAYSAADLVERLWSMVYFLEDAACSQNEIEPEAIGFYAQIMHGQINLLRDAIATETKELYKAMKGETK